MPALTIPSPTHTPRHPASISPTTDTASSREVDATASDGSRPRARSQSRSRSRSPDHPPVSPLTPTQSVAQLAPRDPPRPLQSVAPPPPPVATFRPQPPSVSISESENPDAIALRSAISLLQLQREKSKRDLKTLQDLKSAAISDPQAFARSLQAQHVQPPSAPVDMLTPTLAATDSDTHFEPGRKDSADIEPATKFAPVPQPQNIIRCPPVNWAKYHLVGESLDKMHNEQKRYPGSSEPSRSHQSTKAPPHAVAAPYSPFLDGMSNPSKSHQRGAKKASS